MASSPIENGRTLANGQLEAEQYKTSRNLEARWAVYDELTEPFVDFYEAAGDALDIKPGERVLDVGTGTGAGLLQLYSREPGADYTGVDINHRIYFDSKRKINSEGITNVRFRVGDMQRLITPELRPGSFNVALSMFSVHHVPVPRFGLLSLSEAIAPDGRAVIATIDRDNKPRMRTMQCLALEKCGVKPQDTQIIPGKFDSTQAKTALPQFFETVEVAIVQDAVTRLVTPADVECWLGALSTYRTAVADGVDAPTPARWARAIKEHVRPVIEGEIERDGVFTDLAKRTGFFCKTPILA